MTPTDKLQRLSSAISHAFHQLGVQTSPQVPASLAVTIQQAMSTERRYYHTPDHALALSEADDPLHTLAALFHDVVYYQVDRGFSPDVWKAIAPYVERQGPEGSLLKLVDPIPHTDRSIHMVLAVFGYVAGQALFTNGGSNELLSSLVMAVKLDGIVPEKVLLQVATYIEATIPFRKGASDPFERVAQRLLKVSQEFTVPMQEVEVTRTIQGAVLFANRDVANFTQPDPAAFLEGTWTLLPEFHSPLRRSGEYTLGDYRHALQAMRAFLCSIVAEDVLHQYQGVPSQVEMKENLAKISQNLAVGCAYLETKLLVMAVLEGLALVSGGDVPAALFLGDIHTEQEQLTMETISTDELPGEQPTGMEEAVYVLLAKGVRGPVDLADMKTRSLARYFYARLGPAQIRHQLEQAQEMFAGKINPEGFLQGLDGRLLAVIVRAVARQAVTRRDRLAGLINLKKG